MISYETNLEENYEGPYPYTQQLPHCLTVQTIIVIVTKHIILQDPMFLPWDSMTT